MPAQLRGDWFVHLDLCPLVKLTLAATTYKLMHCGAMSSGNVVVNHSEMDFFNADLCGLKLPDGVGRYMWAVTGGVLLFTALNQDPCPRGAAWLASRSYTRSA